MFRSSAHAIAVTPSSLMWLPKKGAGERRGQRERAMKGCIVQEYVVVLWAWHGVVGARDTTRTTEPEIVRVAVGGQLLRNFARLKVAEAAG